MGALCKAPLTRVCAYFGIMSIFWHHVSGKVIVERGPTALGRARLCEMRLRRKVGERLVTTRAVA